MGDLVVDGTLMYCLVIDYIFARAIAIDYIYSKICLLIDRNYTVIGIICTGVVVTFLIIWWMFLSIGIERWLGVADYVCVLMIVIDCN